MATRVEAAQECPDEAMRQASVASSADMVDKEHTGGEKPVSLIGCPVYQTFFDLIMMMRDANGVGEVKNKNLLERCVKHTEEKEKNEIQKNAGRVFLHGSPWDRWSCGLSGQGASSRS